MTEFPTTVVARAEDVKGAFYLIDSDAAVVWIWHRDRLQLRSYNWSVFEELPRKKLKVPKSSRA